MLVGIGGLAHYLSRNRGPMPPMLVRMWATRPTSLLNEWGLAPFLSMIVGYCSLQLC